jgi:glutamate 5-kinase
MSGALAEAAQSSGARLAEAKRLIVKVGSALLVDQASGALHRTWLNALADDVAAARARGQEVLLVSSGAIAVGRRHLGLTRGDPELEEKQAAAATGQIRLAHAYQEALNRHHITVAQILLSPGDTEERRRHLNARATLNTLLRLGAVPVINENDTVATQEIRFGDNDRLAARVAQMVSADTLVLLSDIDGLYSADPRRDTGARWIPEVREVTPEIEAIAGHPPPGYSSGGMLTKVQAAKIAASAGCRMAIADGRMEHPLEALLGGGRCTWFLPAASPLTARKRWIAATVQPVGAVVIDAGAAAALGRGRSLLPAGVAAVEGRFERGDAVLIKTEAGAVVGRGLVAYDSAAAQSIRRCKSRDIETILGYRGRDEMIHRDDLVLDGPAGGPNEAAASRDRED